MIRCVRIWTDDAGNSVFEEGSLNLSEGARGDVLSDLIGASSISFRETKAGGAFDLHNAPVRQLVLTLSGSLDFMTTDGGHFSIQAGDVLLAEDTTGSGHRWKLVGQDPWRRAYIILPEDAIPPFVPDHSTVFKS